MDDLLGKKTASADNAACRKRCREALLWERYLFEEHTRREVAGWAKRLQFFRFCRAQGGHANDGDQLKAVLRVDDEAGLLRTCAALGIRLERMPAAEAVEALPAGQKPWEANRFPGWQQPRWVEIDGNRVYVQIVGHVRRDDAGQPLGPAEAALELDLMDPDDVWSVTERAVAMAEAIERRIVPLAGQVVDPPQNSRNCVEPGRYPELFGVWHQARALWPWDEPDPRS